MFVLIYFTLIYVWVSEVSSRYMRGWSFSDEMIARVAALILLAVVARVLQALYAAYNDKYYRRTMVARHFRRLSH